MIENNQTHEYQKISDDIAYMLSCYEDMLNRINENETIQLLKLKDNYQADLITNTITDEKITQALGIYFQLITLVEENASIQYHRQLENQYGIAANRGSWGETFTQWKEQGLSEDEMVNLLASLDIMPVLTAHPTESKRIAIIELQRELYLLLVQKENPILSITEKNSIREKIINLLERWWRTGDTYLEKPNLTSERDNIVHYLSKVFPLVLEKSDQI